MAKIPYDTRRVNSSVPRHTNVTLLELVSQVVTLTPRRNGEHHGACPFCGGDAGSDRFIVWDDHFWCRQCQVGGDAIVFLRKHRGYSYAEACAYVGRELKERQNLEAVRKSAAAQAREEMMERFRAWWQRKLRAWNELLDDIRWTEQTYRGQNQDTMSERSFRFWSHRLGDLYFKQTVMQQLWALNEQEQLEVWREEEDEWDEIEREQEEYAAWWAKTWEDWEELLADLEIAQIAARAIERGPERYTDEEQAYWRMRLRELAFLKIVNQELIDLDDAERFTAWRGERNHER